MKLLKGLCGGRWFWKVSCWSLDQGVLSAERTPAVVWRWGRNVRLTLSRYGSSRAYGIRNAWRWGVALDWGRYSLLAQRNEYHPKVFIRLPARTDDVARFDAWFHGWITEKFKTTSYRHRHTPPSA